MFQRILQILSFIAVVSPYCCCGAEGVSFVASMTLTEEPHHCCPVGTAGEPGDPPAESGGNDAHDCPHDTSNGSLDSATEVGPLFAAFAAPAFTESAMAGGHAPRSAAAPDLRNNPEGLKTGPPQLNVRFCRLLL